MSNLIFNIPDRVFNLPLYKIPPPADHYLDLRQRDNDNDNDTSSHGCNKEAMRGVQILITALVGVIVLSYTAFAFPQDPSAFQRGTIRQTSLSLASQGGPPGGPPAEGGPPTGTMTGGGPPAGAVTGGRPGGGPPGTGGPPGGGPGGPPPQNELLESAFEVAFSLLYVGDDSGIRDSSKNLRVLWTRALLASLGKIQDPIAYELLPTNTRWVVSSLTSSLWESVGSEAVQKLDWIVKRTQFIDQQLDEFIKETNNGGDITRQVIVLGSGYDTRALRYASTGSALKFFEIDLPDASATKEKMVNRYLNRNGKITESSPVFIPFDLNDVFTKKASLMDSLKAAGLKEDVPTMVICEAVLFYLIPDAAQKVVGELFDFQADRYCFTDNLAKLGVAPGPPVPTPREKCEAWLQGNGKELIAHDAIWGGAIHFVGAK